MKFENVGFVTSNLRLLPTPFIVIHARRLVTAWVQKNVGYTVLSVTS